MIIYIFLYFIFFFINNFQKFSEFLTLLNKSFNSLILTFKRCIILTDSERAPMPREIRASFASPLEILGILYTLSIYYIFYLQFRYIQQKSGRLCKSRADTCFVNARSSYIFFIIELIVIPKSFSKTTRTQPPADAYLTSYKSILQVHVQKEKKIPKPSRVVVAVVRPFFFSIDVGQCCAQMIRQLFH